MKKINLIISIVVIGLTLSGCSADNNEKNKTPEKGEDIEKEVNVEKPVTTINKIQAAFVEKYGLSASSFEVNIENEEGDYIRGEVTINTQNALFLAKKSNEIVEIVFDGTGAYKCSALINSGFPESLTKGCFDDIGRDNLNSCSDINVDDFTLESEEYEFNKDIVVNFLANIKEESVKKQINKQVKDGVDFANYYKIVEITCGESCFNHFIVDLRNGEIVLKGVPSEKSLEYELDSNLIKIDDEYYSFDQGIEKVCNLAKIKENNDVVGTSSKEMISVRIDKKAIQELEKEKSIDSVMEHDKVNEKNKDETGIVHGAYEERLIKEINLSVQ